MKRKDYDGCKVFVCLWVDRVPRGWLILHAGSMSRQMLMQCVCSGYKAKSKRQRCSNTEIGSPGSEVRNRI